MKTSNHTEKMYDFKTELLKIHEDNIRDVTREELPEEYMLKDGAVIHIEKDAHEVIKTAALDFADFLKISMGIASEVVASGGSADITIALEDGGSVLGEFSVYKGFLIRTSELGIQIVAHDERGAAQALYYIEDLMTFKKAPVLTYGEIKKKPMFTPQMVHSGYGLDDYPDEYLARVAHEGRDAILVFTKDVNQTAQGYLDFNDLIKRAAKYGIDVYAYSYMSSDMSPEDPEAEEYYESNYGRLFRECPGLKGVTLVGESVEFPSKDPHVAKGKYYEINKDGIPSSKPSSGWYPCYDYPIWLNLLKKVIRKHSPKADIVFWTYNWGDRPADARIKLIESLPNDITLLVTFEVPEQICYGKSTGICADYTLSVAGPCECFKEEAEAAKRRGVRLYSMTCTGGRTWDFGVAPYEPMPHQWIERYRAMLKAHDELGLCGIMEAHHFGFYPSFISKLSKHAFFEPREDMDKLLRQILISEFGEENYDAVNKALECFSDGIRYYTPSDADQYGAYRVGPSYPFNLAGGSHLGAMAKLPEYEGAYFGSRICDTTYISRSDWRISPLGMRIKEELSFQEKMLDCFLLGMEHFRKVECRNEKLDTLINLCHFITNCAKTGKCAKEWHILKLKMYTEETKEGLSDIFDKMEVLLKEEIKNAEDTIPLVEKDSLLGFEPSMLYMTDKWHLEWKIRQVNYVIETELREFREALTL